MLKESSEEDFIFERMFSERIQKMGQQSPILSQMTIDFININNIGFIDKKIEYLNMAIESFLSMEAWESLIWGMIEFGLDSKNQVQDMLFLMYSQRPYL